MKFGFLLYTLVTSCSLFEDLSPIVESVTQQDNQIVVQLKPNAQGYYKACYDKLLHVFAIEGEQRTKLLLTEEEAAEGMWDYYVDGVFRYPVGNEGCDLIECIQVDEKTYIGLKSYHREEDKEPPIDYREVAKKNTGRTDKPPETVRSIASKPIMGTLDVEISTYTNKKCTGSKRVETHRTTIK